MKKCEYLLKKVSKNVINNFLEHFMIQIYTKLFFV